VFVALAALVSAGCADDVSPAARVGDEEITTDELLAEVGLWASSPSLLGAVGVSTTEGSAAGSYSTAFVDVVLTNRIRFDLHRAQFDALGLELDESAVADQRESLGPMLDELRDDAFEEQLVTDLVRLSAVINAMGADYEAWLGEAFSADLEINPRYGVWDPFSGSVNPPEGPRPAAGSALTPEL
jgi:hypothetical protein